MKKSFFTLFIAVVFSLGSTVFTACGEAENSNGEAAQEQNDTDGHHHADVYQCPMKCEGDKTYKEAGKCPTCKMDLEKLAHKH